jgi:hypothetical protein
MSASVGSGLGSTAGGSEATSAAPTSGASTGATVSESSDTSASGATTTVGPTTGGTEASTGGPDACAKALMVTGETNVPSGSDAPLYARLLELGFEITVVENEASTVDDIGDACVVILSSIGSSVEVNSKFRDVSVGVVVLSPALYDDMQMVPSASDQSSVGGEHEIEIVDGDHALASGYTGILSIYDPGGIVSWGRPVEAAQVVAIWPGDATRATLFGFEAAADLANGHVAAARRVGFPGGSTDVPVTTARVDLFEAAVRWAAGGP